MGIRISFPFLFLFVSYFCFTPQSALLTMQTNVCEMFGSTDCLSALL